MTDKTVTLERDIYEYLVNNLREDLFIKPDSWNIPSIKSWLMNGRSITLTTKDDNTLFVNKLGLVKSANPIWELIPCSSYYIHMINEQNLKVAIICHSREGSMNMHLPSVPFSKPETHTNNPFYIEMTFDESPASILHLLREDGLYRAIYPSPLSSDKIDLLVRAKVLHRF